jgi:polyribonucleotide nucleotidyltransferase
MFRTTWSRTLSGYRRPDRLRLLRFVHLWRSISWARLPDAASGTKTVSISSTRPLPSMEGFALDLVVAGTTEGVLMVESEAKELSEESIMLGAVMAGWKAFQPVIQRHYRVWPKQAAKDPWDVPEVPQPVKSPRWNAANLKAKYEAAFREAYLASRVKQDRYAAVGAVRKDRRDRRIRQ